MLVHSLSVLFLKTHLKLGVAENETAGGRLGRGGGLCAPFLLIVRVLLV